METVQAIKDAVTSGKRVFFTNTSYEVIEESGHFHIVHACGRVGLHGMVGTQYENVCNGALNDFYIDEI